MATYVPNATQTTEPVESRTVESAALEFRTLKTSINSRIDALQVELDAEQVTREADDDTLQANIDAEAVTRAAGDANLAVVDSALDVRVVAIENALLTIGEGGLPGTVYVQQLSGTGAQTAFTLSATPATSNLVDVYVQGVYQNHTTFTVVGNVLTFDEAPLAGTNNIEVQISVTLALGETDASLVTYAPAGTGAVVTTAQGKLREVISVKDFGAVGDGVTDDTVAIQAAIDYASTGHYTLTVPSGIYLVSTLTLKSNMSMVGELRQAAEAGISVVGSVFKQLGTTGDVFTTANFPISTVGAVITDLIIRGNSSATSGRGVYISQGCTWCSVIRCCVYQFAEQGVILGGTANRAEDCFIGYNNLLGTTGLTFYVGSLEVYGTDQYVLRNQVHGRYDPSPLDGGALSNASGYNVSCLLQTVASFITNNVFEYGDNGAVFVAKHPSSTGGVGRADPYYPVSCQANVVTGNRADRNLGHGFPLVSTTINGPSKNTFTGNSALNNGRNANNTI